MNIAVFFIAIVFLQLAIASQNELVLSEIEKCDFANQDEAGINACFFKVFQLIEQLNKRIERSVKEDAVMNMFIPEPVNLGNFSFFENNAALDIKSDFSNVELYGVSNYTLRNVWVNYADKILYVDYDVNTVDMEAKYLMNGNIILLPVRGKGKFWGKATNVELKTISKMIANKVNNTVMGVENTICKSSIGKLNMHFIDLFEGDPILDEAVHHFLNTNDYIVKKGLIPIFDVKVGHVLQELINDIFNNIPRKLIYPDGAI